MHLAFLLQLVEASQMQPMQLSLETRRWKLSRITILWVSSWFKHYNYLHIGCYAEDVTAKKIGSLTTHYCFYLSSLQLSLSLSFFSYLSTTLAIFHLLRP